MRIAITLFQYFARQFLLSLGVVLSVLTFIIVLFDTLELLRRAQNHTVPNAILVEMVFLKLPYLLLEILPFIILLGSILTFSKLTRNSELVVARASGISAWQFLMPAISISCLLGVLVISILNPVSAVCLSRFETLETKYLDSTIGSLSISSTGIWLKQQDPITSDQTIIHAMHVADKPATLYDVGFFIFGNDNMFQGSVTTPEAVLASGYWNIKQGIRIDPDSPSVYRTVTDYHIPTSLELHDIQNSFSSPETITFWHLPEFINTLHAAGLSVTHHTLYWHKILVTPFLLSAMVFFAAAFSLRLPRKGKTGFLIAGGILAGFTIRFISELVSAMGLAGTIPLVFAAWAPVLISILLGAGLMLHLEDG